MTISTVTTYTGDQIKIKWQEPFLTEGLNAHMASLSAEGIYKGFYLSTNITDLFVTVVADPDTLDHVANIRWAAGASDQEYAVKLRIVNGNFNLDLTAFANDTAVIALYANYTLGATTLVELRVYSLADYDIAAEKDLLVVLGTVKVPAAGVIPADNIWNDKRKSAWQAPAKQAVTWKPILRNGGFEMGEIGVEGLDPPYWTNTIDRDDAPTSVGAIVTSSPRDGGHACFRVMNSTAGLSGDLAQTAVYPFKAGQRIRIRAYFRKTMEVDSGTIKLAVRLYDRVGAAYSFVYVDISSAIAAGALDSYVEVDRIIVGPAGTYNQVVTVGILFTNTVFVGADASIALRIDDVQAWIERLRGDDAITDEGADFTELRTARLYLDSDDPTDASAMVLIDNAITPYGGVVIRDKTGAELTSPALSPHHLVMRSIAGEIAKVIFQAPADTAAANIPRMSAVSAAVGVSNYTKLYETVGATGTTRARIYIDPGGSQILLTSNAKWVEGSSQWQKDTNGQVAHMIGLAQSTVTMQHQVAGTDTWGITGWSTSTCSYVGANHTLSVLDGILKLNSPTTTYGNPVAGTAVEANALYAKNIVKAWANVSSGAVPVLNDGFGVNSTITYTGPAMDIALLNPMASTAYAVIPCLNDFAVLVDVRFNVHILTTSTFRINCVAAGGADVDLSTTVREIGFIVCGKQA